MSKGWAIKGYASRTIPISLGFKRHEFNSNHVTKEQRIWNFSKFGLYKGHTSKIAKISLQYERHSSNSNFIKFIKKSIEFLKVTLYKGHVSSLPKMPIATLANITLKTSWLLYLTHISKGSNSTILHMPRTSTISANYQCLRSP